MKRILRFAPALLLCALLLTGTALAAAPESNVYYQQLTASQKALYDAMIAPESLALMRSGETVSLPVLTGSYSDPSDIDALTQAFANDMPYAYGALEMEHPEIFWTKGYQTNISGGYGGGSYSLYRYLTASMEVNWASGERSVDADTDSLRAAVQAVAELAAAEDGAYAQLLFVHDYLTKANIYNEAAALGDGSADHLPWTPLSALREELSPVCEGYSRAFKLICDALDIPCILVNGYAGEGHMWNQVKLDGQWYAVDVTFDDPVVDGVTDLDSGFESHDYFLVGSETRDDSGAGFGETHTVTGECMHGVYLNVPTLSRSAYAPGKTGAETLPAVTRQVIPARGMSYPQTQTIQLGDREVRLPTYFLRNEQGNPTNYVRLRDLAALLNGTQAQFDVLWFRESGITIVPGQPYEHPNGTENDIPFSGDQPYTAYLADTMVGTAAQPLTAFQLINGSHTYYQLRDLGRALNFNVGWSAARGIFIEPGVPYTDAD